MAVLAIAAAAFIKCCVFSRNPACRAFLEFDQGGAGAEGEQIEQEGEQLLELFCTCPELTVRISECGTVLMLLQLVAKQMGLPNFAAELLQMEFSEAILTHETKLKDVGLYDQALFSVHGEEQTQSMVAERDARVMTKAKGITSYPTINPSVTTSFRYC